MYLKEFVVENVGPIDSLCVTLPFDEAGKPHPTVVVGKNGSGKSILLSLFADAFVLFGMQKYADVAEIDNTGSKKYFRINGTTNQNAKMPFGFAIMDFLHVKDGVEKHYFYHEKSGSVSPSTIASKYEEKFVGGYAWPEEGNSKFVTQDDVELGDIFQNQVFTFFSAGRYETPHWFNSPGGNDDIVFREYGRLANKLNKPIFVERAMELNKSYLINVILDSLVELEFAPNEDGSSGWKFTNDDVQRLFYLRNARNNMNTILRMVFGGRDVKFELKSRLYSSGRISVVDKLSQEILAPSLDHLSTGQSLLLSIFLTVLRYADASDLSKSIDLQSITGIVLVDEIDAHLHSDLLYNQLPELIALFPQVQFIVSCHSPMFLLGMERKFGEGFKILEMPEGIFIGAERYQEFTQSFEYYSKTKQFEEEIIKVIHQSSKPILLLEGQTDEKYIKTALELLNRKDILDRIEIRSVGTRVDNKPTGSGTSGLDAVRKAFNKNLSLADRRIMLLYDCDAMNITNVDEGRMLIRRLQNNEKNIKNKGGIENLFDTSLITDEYYQIKTEDRNDGGEVQITYLLKTKLCDYICDERRVPSDFAKFDQVLVMLESLMA